MPCDLPAGCRNALDLKLKSFGWDITLMYYLSISDCSVIPGSGITQRLPKLDCEELRRLPTPFGATPHMWLRSATLICKTEKQWLLRLQDAGIKLSAWSGVPVTKTQMTDTSLQRYLLAPTLNYLC